MSTSGATHGQLKAMAKFCREMGLGVFISYTQGAVSNVYNLYAKDGEAEVTFDDKGSIVAYMIQY